MNAIERPQSLAAFPLPAGLLLVGGSADDVAAVRSGLVAGRLPGRWPAALRGHELAHAGDVGRAAAVFAEQPQDPVCRFNRFVLEPEGVDPAVLRAALPDDVAPLVDVVGYMVGLHDAVPEVGASTGEVAAVILSAQASAALGHGSAAQAVRLLKEAAQRAREAGAAAFAALAQGNAGTIAHEHGLDRAEARADLEAALAALAQTDLWLGRAELHHQLATLLHEDASAAGQLPHAAIHHYYSTLQLVTEESAPHLWAAANLSLGTAYLTMPMTEASDTLRSGVAMQGLRAALRVFTPRDYPQEWAVATLNLANALVYAPSIKQGDNVVEAVELYEAVLATRDRHVDPIGRARVLANQGNALAHLGIFDQAHVKLHEARQLFEEHLDHDSVMMVRSVLDEIARAKVTDDPKESR